METDYDLLNEINQKRKDLTKSIKSLRTLGTDLAKKEYDYKIALSKKVYELKEQNIAVTMISLVVYGDPEVAELRRLRDEAEVVYHACDECINALKLELKLIDNQYSREWGQANES